MALQLFDEEGFKIVKITGSLTVQDVNAVKGELDQLFNVEHLILDLSELNEFDSSALQLLYTFKRDRDLMGYVTKISSLSEVVKTFLSTYNMEL